MNSDDDLDDKGTETKDSDSAEEKKKRKKEQSYRDRMRELLDNREADFYEEGEE
jgi:hypothetical protein